METRKKTIPEGILNIEGLAEFLGLPQLTVTYYIKEGKIPAYKFGKGRWLISIHELIEFIENRGNRNDSSKKGTD